MTKELVDVLGELAVLLERDGETHWRAWMLRARTLLIDADYSGLDFLLSANGGMGSFNDLLLGRRYEDGVFAGWKPEARELNAQLNTVRGKAWELAKAIKRHRQM